MKKKMMISFLMSAFLLFGAGNALALLMVDISYDYTDNGGGNYTFDFTVSNTSDEPSMLDLFNISFDADPVWGNYSNITWVDNQSWDYVEAEDWDPAYGDLPGYVLADDYFGAGGIPTGGSVSGFTVSFDYAGALAPEAQLFSYYAWFSDLEGEFLAEIPGTTRYVPTAHPVPEPTTILLLGTGLLALSGYGRKLR